MCLYITSGPHVAENDFYVYKRLRADGPGISPYRNFKWTPGYEYLEDEMRPSRLGRCKVINRGLHAYRRRKDAYTYKSTYRREKVVRMIVPKGATYYLGSAGEIATDRMIYPAE